MMRSILAIVAGYVTLVLGVTSTLAILFFAVRDAFPSEPGPYRGPDWVLWVELVSGFAVAVLGGYVCGLVARRRELAHALVLSGIMVALGIVSASVEAGLKPLWSTIGIIVVGALGVLVGARWRAAHAALSR